MCIRDRAATAPYRPAPYSRADNTRFADHSRLHISTKPRSALLFLYHTPLVLLVEYTHTPKAQRVVGIRTWQANGFWFQTALQSALTATNGTENAVVDFTESAVKPT